MKTFIRLLFGRRAGLIVALLALTVATVSAGPTISVTAFPSKLENPGDEATFTLSLSNPAPHKLAVNFLMTGLARAGTNYLLLGNSNKRGQIVIPAGASSATVTLHSLQGDFAAPVKENAVFNLLSGSGYHVGSPIQAEVILDEED